MPPAFRLRIDGHGTGLANCLARRLEDKVDFVAFKMPHPLEKDASVILTAADEAAATREVRDACEGVRRDLDDLLLALPPDAAAEEAHWPERSVTHPTSASIAPRQISEEG